MKCFTLLTLCAVFLARHAWAGDGGFTNSLKAAEVAAKQGNVEQAAADYDVARPMQTNNAANMCVLSRGYCDLTSFTNSTTVQKDLVVRALDCAQRAVALDPSNATAYASVAVCYAKNCAMPGTDVKTQLSYSRLFKQEAEKAIALDPKQDVAYYLIGRWNYGIARLGFFSRAYVKVVYGGVPNASFKDAVNYFKKACQLAPNRIIYHAGLAMAYEAMGEKKLEIDQLKTCCALKPSDREDVDAQKEAAAKLNQDGFRQN
ncbi:MAG TPA: hypothetical protein VH280_05600 [Verrucomicrobiae bacterium]|nr:hypothetical protein [Verrucomicrobiae bacterium]